MATEGATKQAIQEKDLESPLRDKFFPTESVSYQKE